MQKNYTFIYTPQTFLSLSILVFLWGFVPMKGFSQLPEGFIDELVSGGWNGPVGIEFDETGRQYVWEKSGKVYLIEENVSEKTLLLDISEEVSNWRDHGLMSIALHPNFTENGWMYLYYGVDRHHLLFYDTPTYDPNASIERQASIGRITRYTVNVDGDFSVDEGSRHIILGETLAAGIPLLHESHGVGTILFGTDGSLLASVGDGSTGGKAYGGGNSTDTYAHQAINDGILRPKEDVGSFRAQMVDALNGKILRIDPITGDGIPSNPFYDPQAPRAPKSRVWALGFRNPFRFALKPGTGSHSLEDADPGVLYVGDVGWARWEEISVVTEGGQNFGWPLYEGYEKVWQFGGIDTENPDAPNPLYEKGECDNAFYLFEDLIAPTENSLSEFNNPCTKFIKNIHKDLLFTHTRPVVAWNNKAWNPPTRAFTPSKDQDGQPITLQLGEADSPVDGDSFDGISAVGGIFMTGDNFPPEFQLTYIAADFEKWLKRMEFGPGDELLSVRDFHDKALWVVDLKVHPISGELYYVLHLGEIRKISFGGNAAPISIIESDKLFGTGPLEVAFSGNLSSDPEEGALSYHWDFGDGKFSEEMDPVHTFTAPGNEPFAFTVTLTVTDSAGVSASSSQIISLNNTPPNIKFTSFKDGGTYSVNGLNYLPLEAEVTDNEHAVEDMQFAWQTFLHHNTHFHAEPVDSSTSTFTSLSPLGCELETYYYRIRLTVTDPAGLSTEKEALLYPYCGPSLANIERLEAQSTSNKIKLDWKVESEANVETYVIERSLDEINFRPIGNVEATGQTESYVFIDPDPQLSFNYYRLKMQAEDGTYEYSSITSASFPGIPEENFLIYPNPVQSELTVELRALDGLAELELFNLMGQSVKSFLWNGINGEQDKQIFSLQDLNPGIYFYQLRTRDISAEGLLRRLE